MEAIVEACAICSLRLVSAIANLGQGEIGKTIRKDNNARDLPACKGTLAICPALSINYKPAIMAIIIFIEMCTISEQASYNINNTFHSTDSVIRLVVCAICMLLHL